MEGATKECGLLPLLFDGNIRVEGNAKEVVYVWQKEAGTAGGRIQ